VITVRVLARADDDFAGPSDKARVKLIIELQESLVDKENRVKFLQAVTGLPLNSQNQLTAHYTSVLIQETIDGKNRNVIQDIERFIEGQPGSLPWNLFPWEHPVETGSDLSDMQPPD
jgi:hypothetical protein